MTGQAFSMDTGPDEDIVLVRAAIAELMAKREEIALRDQPEPEAEG